MNVGNEFLRAIAQNYCNEHGLPVMREHNIPVNTQEASEIAAIYEHAPMFDDSAYVMQCYRALRQELHAQYQVLLDNGYTFTYSEQDGYKNSQEMCEDVRNNKHLTVYTGGDVHPLLQEDNFIFRAVHDMFGHAACGYTFGPRGEYNAWIHHSMMFSHDARQALTAETKGQNSWFHNGPYSALPVKERPFAQQKVFLLPETYTAIPIF